MELSLEETVFGYANPKTTKNQTKTSFEDFFEIDNIGTFKKQKTVLWEDEHTNSIKINLNSNITKKLITDLAEIEVTGSEYEIRLQKQFNKLNPIPIWATNTTKNNNLLTTKSLIIKSSIGDGLIDIKRLKDANQMGYSQVA